MKINLFNNNLSFNAMKEREVTVQQPHGIHLIPAGCVVKLAQTVPFDVYISKQNEEANVKGSLMNLLCLEIHKGDTIKIKVDEKYPPSLLDTLVACLSASTQNQCLDITDNYFRTHK